MSESTSGLDVELKSPLAKAALFLVLLAVGVVMTVWGAVRLKEALGSRDWPSVQGTVLVSETRHVPASQSPDRRSSYEPEVAVEYEVDGHSYVCDRITFASFSFESAIPVHQILRAYPVGESVAVHYDPDEPARSVLKPGLRFIAFLLPAFGVVLTIGTIAAGAWSLMHRQEEGASGES